MGLHGLSDKDLTILRKVIQGELSRLRNTSGRAGEIDAMERNAHMAPEVYVALTPNGGIPARSGYYPGKARCAVYEIIHNGVDDVLAPVSDLDETVYNFCPDEVPENHWIEIVRDKFGKWVVPATCSNEEESSGTGSGSGTGTGTGTNAGTVASCTNLARIRRTDCILVTALGQEAVGTWDGSGWQSTDTIQYLTGTAEGAVRFWFANGAPHLSIDGLELLYCGGNTFIGGPLTGHADQTDGTPCNGTTFTATVTCTCCSIEGWDGPGWYCVREADSTGTGTADCVVVELLEEDRCDDTIEICSGPYGSEAEAIEACTSGTGTGVGYNQITACDTLLPEYFCATVVGIGGDTPAAWLGFTFVIGPGAGGSWGMPGGAQSPEGGNCGILLEVACGGVPGTLDLMASGDFTEGAGFNFTPTTTSPFAYSGTLLSGASEDPPQVPICVSILDLVLELEIVGCNPP